MIEQSIRLTQPLVNNGKNGVFKRERLEQYNVEAIFKQASAADGQFKDDILSIYPSTFLSYNPGENNSFNLSFSRRVQTEYRPGKPY
jgi:hypothetical protein